MLIASFAQMSLIFTAVEPNLCQVIAAGEEGIQRCTSLGYGRFGAVLE